MKSLGHLLSPSAQSTTPTQWLAASVADGQERNTQKTFLYVLRCSYLYVDAYRFFTFSQGFQGVSLNCHIIFSLP